MDERREKKKLPENTDEPMSRRGAQVDAEAAAVEPRDFDADAFLRGVRPTVRSVLIFERADLIGPMEELADRIDRLPDGPEVDALIDELERLRAQFDAGKRYYRIEARSSEWVKNFRIDVAKRLGVDPGDFDSPAASDDEAAARVKVLVAQMVAQIVNPGQVTADTLYGLMDANEGEFGSLLTCMQEANAFKAASAKVLTRDFSQRRSTKPKGTRRAASSTR